MEIIVYHSGLGILGWFIVIVAGMAILSLFSKKKKDNDKNEKVKIINELKNNFDVTTLHKNTPNYSTKNAKKFVEQKTILDDLKTNGVLSEKEYTDKINLILTQEQIDKTKIINEQIQIKVNEMIKPHLEKLSELTKTNILSKEEFQQKKELLIQKYTNEIQEMSRKEIKLSLFEKIKKNELTGVEVMGVTRLERKLSTGDILLKSKDTKIISVHSEADIDAIIEYGATENYILIEL